MMHIKDGRWIIECDDCPTVFDTEAKEKEEAIQTAMNNGWVIVGRFHYCEECEKEQNDDQD